MSNSINGLDNSRFWKYTDLALFQSEFERVDQANSSNERNVSAVEGPDSQASSVEAAKKDVPSDTGMTRFLDGIGGSSVTREVCKDADFFACKHRLAAPGEAPGLPSADDLGDIVNVLFGGGKEKGRELLKARATTLSKMMIANVQAETGKVVSDAEKAKILKVCETAVEKSLRSEYVRGFFDKDPGLFGGLKQIAFRMQLAQIRLDELANEKAKAEAGVKGASDIVTELQARCKEDIDAIAALLNKVIGQVDGMSSYLEGSRGKQDAQSTVLGSDALATIEKELETLKSDAAKLRNQWRKLAGVAPKGNSIDPGSLQVIWTTTSRVPKLDLANPEVDLFQAGEQDPTAHLTVTKEAKSFAFTALNGALGLAELLYKGEVSEDGAIALLDGGDVYSLRNDMDVLRMQQRTAEKAKEEFTQEKEINRFLAYLEKNHAAQNISDDEFRKMQLAMLELVEARKKFTRVLDFDIKDVYDAQGRADPAKVKDKIEDVKKRLMQFRYDLQRSSGQVNKEFGHWMECLRRKLSNLRGNRHLESRFATNKDRDNAYGAIVKLEDKNGYTGKLLKLFDSWTRTGDISGFDQVKNGAPAGKKPARGGAKLPRAAMSISDRVARATKMTHEANNAARNYQSVGERRKADHIYATKIATGLRQNGGSRSIITNTSFKFLASIGAVGNKIEGALDLSKKKKVTASVAADGVFTLSIADVKSLGIEGKVESVGGLAEVGGGVEGRYEEGVQLKFTSLDDFVVFDRTHKLGLLDKFAGETVMQDGRTLLEDVVRSREGKILSKVKNIFKEIGAALGFRVHASKYFDDAVFDMRMRQQGVFGELDRVEHERRNGTPTFIQVTTAIGTKFSANLNADAVYGPGKDGNEKLKRPQMKGNAALDENFGLEATRRNVRKAEDEFKYDDSASMMKTVNDPAEYLRTVFGKTDKGVKMFKTIANMRDDAGTKDIAGYAETLFREYEEIRTLHERGERYLLEAFAPENRIDDEKDTMLTSWAERSKRLAFLNELIAKKAEELLIGGKRSRKMDTKTFKLLKTVVDQTRNGLAPRLSTSKIAYQSPKTMAEHLLFGTTREDAPSPVTSTLSGSFEWNTVPDIKEDKDKKVDGNSKAKADGKDDTDWKQVISYDLLQRVAPYTGVLSGTVKLDATSIKFGQDDNAMKPWTQQDTIKLGVELPQPANLFSAIIAGIKAANDFGKKDGENGAWATIGKELGTYLETILAYEEKRAQYDLGVDILGAGLGKLFPGESDPKNPSGILYKRTSDSRMRIEFTFCEGAHVMTNVSDVYSTTETIGIKLKTPEEGFSAGAQISHSTTQTASKVLLSFMRNPPITSFLGSFADVLAASGKDKANGFLRKHMHAVRATLKAVGRFDPSKTKPNEKGDGVKWENSFAGERKVLIANVRRDMKKLLKIAESSKLPAAMKNEAKRIYYRLFEKPPVYGDKIPPYKDENGKLQTEAPKACSGSWGQTQGLFENGAKPDDETCITALSELFSDLNAAYGLIERAADRGVVVTGASVQNRDDSTRQIDPAGLPPIVDPLVDDYDGGENDVKEAMPQPDGNPMADIGTVPAGGRKVDEAKVNETKVNEAKNDEAKVDERKPVESAPVTEAKAPAVNRTNVDASQREMLCLGQPGSVLAPGAWKYDQEIGKSDSQSEAYSTVCKQYTEVRGSTGSKEGSDNVDLVYSIDELAKIRGRYISERREEALRNAGYVSLKTGQEGENCFFNTVLWYQGRLSENSEDERREWLSNLEKDPLTSEGLQGKWRQESVSGEMVLDGESIPIESREIDDIKSSVSSGQVDVHACSVLAHKAKRPVKVLLFNRDEIEPQIRTYTANGVDDTAEPIVIGYVQSEEKLSGGGHFFALKKTDAAAGT